MELYRNIISRFPRGGISYIFAYGSGVKQQLGYEAVSQQKNNVIDLIFCTRDPLGWHAENIKRHPSHYSALRFFGPNFIMNYQERWGAGVYFNTLVPLKDLGVTVKYGVVSPEQLMDDLLEWKHLYLAGRLQKPVQNIVPPDDNNVALKKALKKNLQSAFQVALLLLPEHFTGFDLFHTISNLSYKGDFRMIFGENKQKVRNIVEAQENDFFELYRPAMKRFAEYVAIDFSAKEIGTDRPILKFEQNKSHEANAFHLRKVPAKLREAIIRNAAYRGNYADIVSHLAGTNDLNKIVQISVNDIVWRSSIAQSVKNIPSAGVFKSIVYSYRKALKTFTK